MLNSRMTHSYRRQPGLDSRLRKSLLWVQMEGEELRIRQMKHAAEVAARSGHRALLAQAKEWHIQAEKRFLQRAAGATSTETGAETLSAFWRMVLHHPRSAKKNRALPAQQVRPRGGCRTRPTSLRSAAFPFRDRPRASRGVQGALCFVPAFANLQITLKN